MPDLEREQEIEFIVNKFIKENGLNVPGFDLTKFLTQKYDFVIGSQNFNKNITGVLLVDEDKYIPHVDAHRLISINHDLGVDDEYIYNRKKRFIIAHEFAYFILNKDQNSQFAHKNVDKKNTPKEREAEYFARCLLMPRKLMFDILNINGIKEQTSCEKSVIVSRLFFVPQDKAKMRIEELGLT